MNQFYKCEGNSNCEEKYFFPLYKGILLARRRVNLLKIIIFFFRDPPAWIPKRSINDLRLALELWGLLIVA